MITGADVDYNGSPTGYTLDPQEHISYVEAHDNETLFDKIQYAAPDSATVADRVRMQNMGISLVTLSQGVPFYHAGVDMLRSKSLDRNSYNSGDWFNALDFTYETNGWGRGLPLAGDNGGMYDVMQPLLANPDIVPTKDDILAANAHMREMLQIRKSSKLFRLETAARHQGAVDLPQHRAGADSGADRDEPLRHGRPGRPRSGVMNWSWCCSTPATKKSPSLPKTSLAWV